MRYYLSDGAVNVTISEYKSATLTKLQTSEVMWNFENGASYQVLETGTYLLEAVNKYGNITSFRFIVNP